VFIETHYDPSVALSDGPNQIRFEELPALLRKLTQIHEIVR
jgi:2-dehydro-3-deoxyphosphooctonate aldolase (KDO 8-P synthase)